MKKKSSISIYNYELTNMQDNSIYFLWIIFWYTMENYRFPKKAMRRNNFRRQAGKGLHPLGYPENLPVKIGKGGEKGGSGKGSPEGKT